MGSFLDSVGFQSKVKYKTKKRTYRGCPRQQRQKPRFKFSSWEMPAYFFSEAQYDFSPYTQAKAIAMCAELAKTDQRGSDQLEGFSAAYNEEETFQMQGTVIKTKHLCIS